MRLPLMLILVTCLAGCMMGPDYRRPMVELPESFRFAEKDARALADTEWWREFRDPILDDLITEALVNNKNVKIAAANIQQAAGVLTETRAPLFPQANYGAGATRQRASELNASPFPDSVSNPYDSLQLFGGASWEIDFWGRIRRLSESARASLLASEEARRGTILSLVASVAGSYLQLRGLDEQLVIARRNLASYGESVRLFEVKFKYGQVSMMVVEQARTQYEAAAATLPQIESQIGQTENALSILLGRNPGPIVRGRSITELAFPGIPAGLPSQLLERRPDLVQAEQNLVAANALIGAVRALYFPTISLTGSLGKQSDDLSRLFNGPARVWSYSGSVTGPLFTAGSIYGQVEQAEAGQKAALLTYEAAIQSAFADMDNALVARSKLVEQLAAQERLVRAASEYERLARLQYDGGYVPYSTVLQAQQQLFPAELNQAQYLSSLLAAYVNLYKVMGGGWVNEAEKKADSGSRAKEMP